MKIIITTQDLEARGERFKYAGGSTYVIRDLAKEQLETYDSVYFKEYIHNQLGSSYTGKAPTSEYEMQTYVTNIQVAEDDEKECEDWLVPWTMQIRDVVTNGRLSKEIFVHRFNPREEFWSDAPEYADLIGSVEQHYISPKDELREYKKEYIKKGETHKCVGDFIHRDFSRKPYDPWKEYYEEEAS